MKKIETNELKNKKRCELNFLKFYHYGRLEDIDWDLIYHIKTETYRDFVEWFLMMFKVKISKYNEYTYTYDNLGNRISTTDGIYTWKYTLDERFNIIEITEFNDNDEETSWKKLMSYDINNNKISERMSTNRCIKYYTYDNNGNCTSVKEGDYFTPQYSKDVCQWEYNNDNNIISETKKNGETYKWIYDDQGKVIGETDPNGTFTLFRQEENGNLKKVEPWKGMEKFIYGEDYKTPMNSSYTNMETNSVLREIELIMKNGKTIKRSYVI